jgi:predicted DNA-binding transcriptional regulator AlpA
VRTVSAVNPLDRATWPEVLHRVDMAAVYGVSVKTIDRMREMRELPPNLPGSAITWSKADLCAWLDRPALRKGFRVA